MMNLSHRPIIAIIGCDGSGKSTVGQHVTEWMAQYGPTVQVHLGKQSGNMLRSIKHWPIIGQVLGKNIEKKGIKAKHRIEKNKLPGLLPALVNTFFVKRRLKRFRQMLKTYDDGNIIVTDRYPQLTISGAYDGPKMPRIREGNRLVCWLADYELNAFKWMTSYRPDLVIRLNVDFETACKRKPDHKPASLKRKIDATPKLEYRGAPIVDIDTTQSLDKVLKQVESAISAYTLTLPTDEKEVTETLPMNETAESLQ
ncbi:dTMP kinase [Cernens ardua]|uniref:dTMP kinase n=1 Tax=Cernens ardua TaxID=3402176 RepID=UPI003F9C532B